MCSMRGVGIGFAWVVGVGFAGMVSVALGGYKNRDGIYGNRDDRMWLCGGLSNFVAGDWVPAWFC